MAIKGKYKLRAKVEWKLAQSMVKELHDMQFVPELSYNLLSVESLITRGNSTFFDGNVIINKKSGMKVHVEVSTLYGKVKELHDM